MKYLVVVEKGEKGYSASVPDLPGCIGAGQSELQALQTVQQAIKDRLEKMRQAGETIPARESFAVEIEAESAQSQKTSTPKAAGPLPAIIPQFIDHLLSAQFTTVVPTWDYVYHRCHALPHDIAALLVDCEAMLHPEDEQDRFDLQEGLLGGKIGSLKCSLMAFLNDFMTSQPYFEAALPAREVFDGRLTALNGKGDVLTGLRGLAAAIIHNTGLMRERGYDPQEVAWYFFWLARTATVMLAITAEFDMVKIHDPEEYGGEGGGCGCGEEDECGCGHGHDHDCDCDCDCEDGCDCDCDCGDDCDCHHHHHDEEERPGK